MSDQSDDKKLKRHDWIILAILAIVAAWLAFSCLSCSTLKHSHSSAIAVHDTTKIALHDTFTREHTSTDTRYVHDTVITIPGYTVTNTFTAAQIRSATYQNGYKIPQAYNSAKGNVHSIITIDTAGNVTIQCQADSLKTVIANLVTDNKVLTDSLTRSRAVHTATISDTSSSIYDKILKSRLPWYVYLFAALVAICIIVEIFIKVKGFFIKKIP